MFDWWGTKSGREYINSSQISAWVGCPRKWAFQYLNPEGGDAQGNKFAEFGIAVHQVLEHWFVDGDHPANHIEWTADVREVAESGLHHWPAPGEVDMVVEGQFTMVVNIDGTDVYLKGTRDLVYTFETGVVLGDHKTTTDFRWAKTVEDLEEDVQCNMYALATMWQWDVQYLVAKWVYYRTRNARKSLPVTINRTWDQAIDVLRRKALPVIRDIQAVRANPNMRVPRDLPTNVHHCDDYGGCPFRKQCGVKSIDRIKARIAHMGLKEQMLARLNKNKAEQADKPGNEAPEPINPPEAQTRRDTTPAKVASKPPKAAAKAAEVVVEVEEEECTTPTSPDRGAGAWTLLVGCIPVGTQAFAPATEWTRPAHNEVMEAAEVGDFRMVDFAKGPGLLAAACRKVLHEDPPGERVPFVYLDPTEPGQAACLEVFQEAATLVIRRF